VTGTSACYCLLTLLIVRLQISDHSFLLFLFFLLYEFKSNVLEAAVKHLSGGGIDTQRNPGEYSILATSWQLQLTDTAAVGFPLFHLPHTHTHITAILLPQQRVGNCDRLSATVFYVHCRSF
jgi:hypothetical protein